jgi:hypothetical protein
MKKLLLTGIAALFMATSASAQSSMPRSIISGNQFCTYGNSGAQWCVPHTPMRAQRINCLRANYASTLAAQNCLTARTAKRTRR